MKRKIFTLLAILLIPYLAAAQGQEPEKKQYRAVQVNAAPVIDGILDDQAWQSGEWIDDFTQYEPYNGKPASQRTEFKILYDDNNLYVAFRAFDTAPDSIVNRLTRRDNADGDLAGIIIDSFHDLRTAFLFGVSSSGVKYDQMWTDDGQKQTSSWDPNWWVRTSVNKEGWVAEMKIPLSQLRFDKNSGGKWGIEVARALYRKNETDFWQHIPKDAPGMVHLFGELTGLEKIKPRKIFDITPYGVSKAETYKKEAGNPFRTKGNKFGLNGGLDAKIGVTNNMTMDLTVNPDFGQVEADPSVVNLTAYETFFTEKRPFFIEGNNITNFNIGLGDGDVGNDNLFYSRRIGRRPQGSPDLKDGWHADVPAFTPIIGAAKITGKTKDGLSLGFIEGVTAEVRADIDTIGGTKTEQVEPLTNYFVGRVQRDFNEGNTIIGGIFTGTNRDLDPVLAAKLHKSAYSGGVDFTRYFKKKSWMFNVNAAFSQVNGTKEALQETQTSSARYYQRPDNSYVKFDPNRTSLTGSGGRMQIMKLNGHLNLIGAVLWKSPGFEINDIGYIREADQVLSVMWAGYTLWDPKWIYQRLNINGDFYMVNNFGGTIMSKGFEYNLNMNLKNYWSIYTGGNFSTDQISTGLLRGGPEMKVPGNYSGRIGFSTDYRKKLVLSLNAGTYGGYQKSSNTLYSNLTLEYKPTNYLLFSLNPSVSKSFDELQYIDEITYNNSTRYVFSSIDQKTVGASFRVNFNLSPDLTLQYWGQPFIATGRYYDHKYITDPMAEHYKDRYNTYSPTQKTFDADHYNIDENSDGVTDYTIDMDDFNYKAFLSNLVIRWEYSPGSTLYLVWSQNRNGSSPTGTMEYFNDLGDLFNGRMIRHNDNYTIDNVFLIKFSYRFGLK